MSAIIRNYSAVTCAAAGVQHSFGALADAMGEATIDGEYVSIDRITIPASGTFVLWDASMSNKEFEQVGFRIIGDGTLQVAWRTDLPTSSTNFTALGTYQRWRHKDWPCKMGPFWMCSQTVLGHATAGSETADATGLPALWSTNLASAVTHIIDKIAIRNADSAAAVVVERLIAK